MTKRASLVHFYFGESSYINRLAQETVPVHKALEGYDFQVLLRHETDVGPFELSAMAEKTADIVDVPTADNFIKYLNQLGAEGYEVDIYIFSHGWNRTFRCTGGEYGENSNISASRVEREVQPLNLRAVFQVNCYGETWNWTWLSKGAKVVAGTNMVNFYPTRFKRFINLWRNGETFGDAVRGSNNLWSRLPVYAFIIGDAFAKRKQWGGCDFGRTILGNNDGAHAYFTDQWDSSAPTDRSGINMMRYMSEYAIVGDESIKK